jgi:capsular polysaccharide biosynthesis protein
MVLRTAGRGRYDGQQFWGCSTYPKCRAVVGIKGQHLASSASEVLQENAAGASAQARYERGRQEHAARIRGGWPVLVGITLILMFGTTSSLRRICSRHGPDSPRPQSG